MTGCDLICNCRPFGSSQYPFFKVQARRVSPSLSCAFPRRQPPEVVGRQGDTIRAAQPRVNTIPEVFSTAFRDPWFGCGPPRTGRSKGALDPARLETGNASRSSATPVPRDASSGWSGPPACACQGRAAIRAKRRFPTCSTLPSTRARTTLYAPEPTTSPSMRTAPWSIMRRPSDADGTSAASASTPGR